MRARPRAAPPAGARSLHDERGGRRSLPVKPVFTAAEMRALDARAMTELGIPGPRLMENAGRGAATVIARAFAPVRGKRVVVLCGKGNNGGDGFVVARYLKGRGARAEAWVVARR